MTSEPIHPDTALGPVHLTVSDLARSLSFYQERLGLRLQRRGNGVAHLGAGGSVLLVLWEQPDAPRVRGTTGLYHFAVLVPSRRALARSLRRLIETRTALDGASDHLVSEALYLHDPDRNGIEIYRDRARGDWPFAQGQVRMASENLDLEDVLSELTDHEEPWSGVAPGTTLGHIHLQVSDLVEAERFYVGVLGFEAMARVGSSALFVSAGGYHHHLGLNTWAGAGAPPPPPRAIGLRHFVVRLPNRRERDRVVARVRAAGVRVQKLGAGALLSDPSSNRIVLTAGHDAQER